MPEKIAYTCSCCGKQHEEWPALGYSSPANYNDLSEKEKKTIAELDKDFCIINYPNQTDRFIRCTMTQKVIDHCENLEYGLWVSLSEKSFQDYSDNYNNENHQTQYFGWLSSDFTSIRVQRQYSNNCLYKNRKPTAGDCATQRF